jgi:hypothetical protein
MDFTEESKQAILNLLKTGQRNVALQFIASQFRVSTSDAQKLLEAFELQYGHLLQPVPPAKAANLSGCAGCFSGMLAIISALFFSLGILVIGVGHFISDWMDEANENRMVSAIVAGKYFTTPDSGSVKLILEYNNEDEVRYDTGKLEYPANMYQPGDTIQIASGELGFLNELSKTQPVEDTQKGIYFVGGVFIFMGVIAWLISRRVRSVRTL